MNTAGSDNNFHFCPSLVYQRRRLQGALPAPNDHYSLAGETADIPLVTCVSDQLRRHLGKLRWTAGKRLNACSNNYAPRVKLLAIVKSYAKPRRAAFDPFDFSAVDFRHRLAMKPEAIFHELVKRNRHRDASACSLK